ncbi:hypothetical protein RND81_01G202300 [Saponaria officinalis]|uniref:Uncharacterized protein n=1 Tax=Saponaria officinalis TaxID=3572 RepID=A0AAW1NG91_SAPOF
MAHSKVGSGKAILIIMKYITFPFSLLMGVLAITSISSGAPGFNFLGILFLIIAVLNFILFFVDCATADNKEDEDVFMFESLWCGVPSYILMIILGIFTLAVSSHGNGKSIPGIQYKEYELGSYSKWVQHRVNTNHLWEKHYKRTLIKHNVCKDMVSGIYKLDTIDKLHQRPLNSFESGCCKPPEECKFNYTSPTIWTNSTNTTATTNNTNADCYKWSNDPNTYCFNCLSCKAAFAQDVKDSLYIPRVVAVILLGKLVLLTLLGCLIICCKACSGS